MTCNITQTPCIPEPLPIYTRDPETASIRSSAPSYISEAPSYHSYAPRPALHSRSISLATSTATPGGRPTPRYAPGFRRHGSQGPVSDIEAHTYNIASWSSATSGPQARHYRNVAHRRATIASAESERQAVAAALPSLKNSTIPLATLEEEEHEKENEPIRPNEDPALVGDEAAERARARRLYLAKCKGEEILYRENKNWDFMLGQMADWDEREKSWTKFREEAASK